MTMKNIIKIHLLIFLAMFLTSVSAVTDKLSSDGVLHSVEVIYLSGSTDAAPKTYLAHTLQKPDGTIEKYIIPQTGDSIGDIEPQLDLNPTTQQPVVVWSRFDGKDFEIAIASFDGVRWSQTKILTSNVYDDREPRITAENSNLIHLMWKEDMYSVPTYYHLCISSIITDSFGQPEVLYAPTENLVLPDGTTPANSTFPLNQTNFFAFYVSSPEPRRIVVWGGQDDPSPITFQEGFRLADSIQNLSTLKAEKLNGKLVVLFRSADALYYTYRTNSGWTPFRMVKLDSSIHEGKAELLIKEMIGRLSQ